ncbi:MAG TPA: hypothetical protein PK537_12805 [Candidatus Limiplasma sp.]|nr:hypothetical protein [Candidatus Limiplasma sp.]
MSKALVACQVDFILFLKNRGFPELALALARDIEKGFSEPDVLHCAMGIVLSEGLGRGVEAQKQFAEACRIHPDYPQAARLAASYALTADEYAHYNEVFIKAMEGSRKSGLFFAKQKKDFSIRSSPQDEMYRNLLSGMTSAAKDRSAVFYMNYYDCVKSKLTAKALSYGSLITELEKRSPSQPSQATKDMRVAVVRDSIERGIVLDQELAGMRKEYGKFVPETENLVLQDVVKQCEYYLEAVDPYDVVVLNWAASQCVELKRYEDCIAYADRAIEAQPEGYYFHYLNKARALYKAGQPDKADALLPMISREVNDAQLMERVEATIHDGVDMETLTLSSLAEYFYHMFEGNRYAADDELKIAGQAGQQDNLLRLFAELRARRAIPYEVVMDLMTLYTPALLYHQLVSTFGTFDPAVLAMLSDTARMAAQQFGYRAEAAAELCWYFALSPQTQAFTAPLLSTLKTNADKPSIAIAAKRTMPFLPELLKR